MAAPRREAPSQGRILLLTSLAQCPAWHPSAGRCCRLPAGGAVPGSWLLLKGMIGPRCLSAGASARGRLEWVSSAQWWGSRCARLRSLALTPEVSAGESRCTSAQLDSGASAEATPGGAGVPAWGGAGSQPHETKSWRWTMQWEALRSHLPSTASCDGHVHAGLARHGGH